ncbi:MAG TPA: M23 family metallopeptidase [Caulobacteraceae bacterium]|nr:M23 family metallopeptidase [Caulobacteraceae bacterium]
MARARAIPIDFFRDNAGRLAGLAAATMLAAAGLIDAARADAGPLEELSKAAKALEQAPAAVQPAAPQAAAVAAPAPRKVLFGSPVRGFPINSFFGLRKLPKEPKPRPHEGVDYAAPAGQPVLAAAEGEVLRAGTSPTYGRYVEVEHPNGVTSFYAHLSRTAANARPGEEIDGGEVLGFVGSTGRSTGPHLHFEIRKEGRQLNPVKFLGKEFTALHTLRHDHPASAVVASGVRAVEGATPGRVRGVLTPANG